MSSVSSPRFHLFTSESVSEGHPDKLADRISDRILDEFLARDPHARVACETMLADQCVILAGEFKTRHEDDFGQVESMAESLVRKVLRETGYHDAETGIDPDTCEVQVRFNGQSGDINQGVDREDGILGAGDQGLMFGFSCDETPELMPAPITYAHRLVQQQATLRKNGSLPWLGPDAKSQVTFRYDNGRPTQVEAVVLSTQHDPGVGLDELRAAVLEHIIEPVIPDDLRSPTFFTLINPTGRFVTGGPKGDVGLTGRKIIVDTYGGAAPHGGGAFSGKDPSKVDRSGAYMARHIAKNVVAAGLANRCTVQLAYSIGRAEPVSLMVDTHSTGRCPNHALEEAVRRVFPLNPAGIIAALDLNRPIYSLTSAYGHFGRELPEFAWERADRVGELLSNCLA